MEVTLKHVAPASSHFEQLEAIMDQSSVDQMLLKMSRICYHGWYMESSGDYCRLTRSKGKKVSK